MRQFCGTARKSLFKSLSKQQTFIDTYPKVAFANVGLDLIRWVSYPQKRGDHSAHLGYKNQAGYGEQTVVRLAKDVGLSKNSLYRALDFYRFYPIFPSKGKFIWTHYQALLSRPTVEAQRLYEDAAVKNGWSVRELEAQIKSVALETVAPV